MDMQIYMHLYVYSYIADWRRSAATGFRVVFPMVLLMLFVV